MTTSTTPGPDNDRTRTPQGRFVRDPRTIARDAEALKLRGQGQTLQAISDLLGYGSRANVLRALRQATQDVVGESAAEYVRMQLDLLGKLKREAIAVLERDHVVVSHGHVVKVGPMPKDGEPDTRTPLLDDGPKLQAIATLKSLAEREAKLLGLDAAVKIDATVHQVDAQDIELRQMVAEQQARNALLRAQIEEQG